MSRRRASGPRTGVNPAVDVLSRGRVNGAVSDCPGRSRPSTVPHPAAVAGPESRGGPLTTEQHSPQHAAPSTGRSNGLGVAGFVTGLLGALLSWIPIAGIILGLLGVVLGGVGVSQGRRTGSPTGLAMAGVVLGVLALVVAIVLVAVLASNA